MSSRSPHRRSRAILLAGFAVGLLLRLSMLSYRGTFDMDTNARWGRAVVHEGLAHAYAGNYFPLAYQVFGAVDWLASRLGVEAIPVYKAANLAFDVGTFWVLTALLTQSRGAPLSAIECLEARDEFGAALSQRKLMGDAVAFVAGGRVGLSTLSLLRALRSARSLLLRMTHSCSRWGRGLCGACLQPFRRRFAGMCRTWRGWRRSFDGAGLRQLALRQGGWPQRGCGTRCWCGHARGF